MGTYILISQTFVPKYTLQFITQLSQTLVRKYTLQFITPHMSMHNLEH
jgi:hypothetical protein